MIINISALADRGLAEALLTKNSAPRFEEYALQTSVGELFVRMEWPLSM